MKTIGERIRQARNALGISGERLAAKVGYKNQSAIGNLENRRDGTGGNKLPQIAKALNVSVDWLMNGPDCEQVPFLPSTVLEVGRPDAKNAEEPAPLYPLIPRAHYWPFRTPVDTFRQHITLDNLEQLNTQIEQMVGHRGSPEIRKNGNGI